MSNTRNKIYVFGEYRLEVERRVLWCNDQPVTISPKVYELLQALVEKAGQPLSKDELLARVWPNTTVEESNLTVSMSALRRVLGERRGENQFVMTLPSIGYQFVMPVTAAVTDTTQQSGVPHADSNGNQDISEPIIENATDAGLIPLAAVAENEPADLAPVTPPSISRVPQVLPAGLLGRRNLWVILALLAVIGSSAGWYWFNRPPQRVSQVRSLAVLPFTPMVASNDSSQNSDETLGLGLADSLIMRLSNSGGLTVRPTNAIQAFIAPNRDLQKIGRALQVEAVLDGRWQRVNDEVQLSAQMVRTSDGAILWAERIEDQQANLLTLQKSLSEQLANALTVQFTVEQRQRLQKDYTANRAAYEDYMRGRYFMVKRDRESMLKAIAAFEQAIERDPNYALAWAGIADCYLIFSMVGVMMGTPDLQTNMLKAKAAAERALALDESLVEAHTALAGVHTNPVLLDETIAKREFARARELNPNYPTFYVYAGQSLFGSGNLARALSVFQRGRELDPLSPTVNTLLGLTNYTLRHFAEAETQLKLALELAPEFVCAHLILGLVYEEQKKYAEARTHFQRAAELSNNGSLPLSALAHLHAVQGQRTEAEALLAKVQTAADEGQISHYFVAIIHIALGNHDQALDLLEHQPRTYPKSYPKIDPQCDPLRGNPRFEALVRSLTP